MNQHSSFKIEPRSSTRIHIFFIIFQLEFISDFQIKDLLHSYYSLVEDEICLEFKLDPNFIPFSINKNIIESQIFSLVENLEQIDNLISKNSISWSFNRISKVDLAILRLAIFEIVFQEHIPNKVAINEAIEIAKAFGSDNSYKFINGILSNF